MQNCCSISGIKHFRKSCYWKIICFTLGHITPHYWLFSYDSIPHGFLLLTDMQHSSHLFPRITWGLIYVRTKKKKSSWNTHGFIMYLFQAAFSSVYGIKTSPSRTYFRVRTFVYFMIWMRLKMNCFIFLSLPVQEAEILFIL